MKKGVTKEQIQRIQSKYSGKSDGSAGDDADFMGEASSRLRTQKTYENKNKNISQDESGLDELNSKKQSIKGLRTKASQQGSQETTGNAIHLAVQQAGKVSAVHSQHTAGKPTAKAGSPAMEMAT